MGHILGVKFREVGQVYFFDSGPFVLAPGECVIVHTEQGYGLGTVVLVRDELPPDAEVEELKPIYRIAAQEDLEKQEDNQELAQEAFAYCRKCIRERELEMKLVDVEVFFDRSKIIFYFTAPNRIDFRELVKDLVRNYRTRIELRQIGVRHETQMVGAVGNCGQVCCCRRFLRKFAPVTIRMAKEQNLFLNPTKISGMCGRLLCCLSYEQSNYEEFHRNCPKVGKKYMTKEGPLKVLRANLFRASLSVLADGGEEREINLDEWTALEPRRPDQQELQEKKVERPADNGKARRGGKAGEMHGVAETGDVVEGAPSSESSGEDVPENRKNESPEARGAEGDAQSDKSPRPQARERKEGRGQEGSDKQGQRRRSRPRGRGGKQNQTKGAQQARPDKPKEQTGKPAKAKRKRRRKPKPKQSE